MVKTDELKWSHCSSDDGRLYLYNKVLTNKARHLLIYRCTTSMTSRPGRSL